MELPILIAILVFASIGVVAWSLLSSPESTRQRAMALLAGFERLQPHLGMTGWAQKYDAKIALAGLGRAELNGFRILALKELAAVGAILLCVVLRIPVLLLIWLSAGAFFLPDLYLRDRRERRRREIVRSLPDFLDMLTLVMEAGLDFGTAISTILRKSRRSALLEEVEIAAQEMRLGVPRARALQNLASRLKIQDVNVFVSAVLNAEQTGTSMASALRIQAGASRERRMQRAEKLALEAPVKMIFPLVFFIFPVIFIVLIGPIIVQWLRK